MIVKGVDTIEFGIDVEDYKLNMGKTLEWFSALKSQAQDSGKEPEIEINNTMFTVHRHGAPFYSYKLSCNDFLIYFMDKEMKDNSPIKVRFLASYLWSYGFENSVKEFYKWLEYFGLKELTTRLSRADICVDIDLIKFVEGDIKSIQTRARGKTKYFVNDEYFEGRQFTGFTIGKGDPLLARIYNKSLEIKKSQKSWFYQVWKEADEKFLLDNEVWRVEFQIRRKALKEFGINRLEDLISNEDALWKYLTEDWLVLKKPGQDKNPSRWQVAKKWTIVQKADLLQVESSLVRKKVKEGNVELLLNQIAGLLLSVGTLSKQETLQDTADMAKRWTEGKLAEKQTTFIDEKNKRVKRFLITH